MRRGARLVVLAVAAGLLAPAPNAVAVAGSGDAASRLGDARGQLGEVQRDLARIEAELRIAQDRIADADARLSAASAELAEVETQLSGAQAVLDAANRRERAAAAELAAAGAELEAHLAAWEGARDALQERAAEAYKHGGSVGSRLLLRGFTAPRDMHDIAVGARTIERLTSADRGLVDRSVAMARTTADARAEVAARRAVTVAEQRVASRERARVAELVTRQELLVRSIEEERAHRTAVLAALEDDQEAKGVLAAHLGAKVRQLQAEVLDAFLRDAVSVPVDGPAPSWAGALPPAGRPWAPAIEAAAAAAGIDGRLFAALVWTESNFAPAAVSHAGALGLAQLMPGTAAGLRVDPYDPMQNLAGGARYLRAQMVQFGRVDLALAAYNAGPGRVRAAGHAIPAIVETQLYVVRVLDRYERLLAG